MLGHSCGSDRLCPKHGAMSSKRGFEAVEFSPHGKEKGRLTLEGLLQHAAKRARCATPH